MKAAGSRRGGHSGEECTWSWCCTQGCSSSSQGLGLLAEVPDQQLQCKLIPLPYIARELCAHPPPFVQMCRGEAPEPLSGLL